MPRITTHPGEVLASEFMEPLGLSARKLAEALQVSPSRVTAVTTAQRSLTADMAIRLGRYFGTTSHFWLNLQQAYDLSLAESGKDYSTIRPRTLDAA